MQAYGCERCGNHSDALTPCELSTGGTLLAEAVHLHADKNRPAPFTIVKVALDDGPVSASCWRKTVPPVAPGQRVTGRLVPFGQARAAKLFSISVSACI